MSSISIQANSEASVYEARLAIVFYCARASGTYATEHDIENGVIQPSSRAVDLPRLRRWIDASGRKSDHKPGVVQLIHPRVLVAQPDLLVWHRPSAKTILQFHKHGAVKVWLPPLLFAVNKGAMSVLAMKYNSRPKLDTPLFHAPVMNCYEDHTICMGSMPRGTDPDSWEASFFGSRFTNHHHSPRGYAKLALSPDIYPLDGRLAPCGLNLGQYLEQLT